ncbi:MAG: penicillin-binding protein 2, partial [Deltaproteobacteria bacterium]
MVRNGNRRRGIFWLFLLVFLILLGRLWQLQVLKGEQYRRLSDKNRLRLVKILPPRGRIYDRRGRLLVANRPSFDLLVTPADVRDPQALAEELSGLIDVPEEEILERIQGARGPYEPVRVKKDLSFEELSRVEANLWDLPGVRIT